MDIKLKEEDRAGFDFALDTNEVLIHASEAVTGEKYFCPVCNCPMHLFTTKLGRRLFGRNPNAQHTDPKCIRFESRAQRHAIVGKPDAFVGQFCHAVLKKERIKDSSAIEEGRALKPSGSEAGEKEMKFSSLKQFYEEYPFFEGDIMIGNYRLCDYFITYKTAHKVLKESDDLGARIVRCRYFSRDTKTQSLIFEVFSITLNYTMKLSVMFPNARDFRNYLEKFEVKKENENGAYKWEKIHDKQDVLIAGMDWAKIEQQRCRKICWKKDCKNCLGFFQVVFTNPKQIYLCPPEDS